MQKNREDIPQVPNLAFVYDIYINFNKGVLSRERAYGDRTDITCNLWSHVGVWPFWLSDFLVTTQLKRKKKKKKKVWLVIIIRDEWPGGIGQ